MGRPPSDWTVEVYDNSVGQANATTSARAAARTSSWSVLSALSALSPSPMVLSESSSTTTCAADNPISLHGLKSQPMNMSYDYDPVGNLTVIGDWSRNEYPVFSYDHLNRVTGVSGLFAEGYIYSASGNLTYKTNVGTYDYNVNGTQDWVRNWWANRSSKINFGWAVEAQRRLKGTNAFQEQGPTVQGAITLLV